MAQIPHADLIADIERFVGQHAIAETTFGRLAVNDGKLVSRLRRGADLTTATERRIRAILAGEIALRGQVTAA